MRNAKIFGEYTSDKNVVQLLVDRAGAAVHDPRKKFFEPGCGQGKIILEVFSRRIKTANNDLEILKILSNIYGADIIFQNILATRKNLHEKIKKFLTEKNIIFDYNFWPLEKLLLERNFIHANLLKDQDAIFFYDWKIFDSYKISSKKISLQKILEQEK